MLSCWCQKAKLRIHSMLSRLKGLGADVEEGTKRQELGDSDFGPMLA